MCAHNTCMLCETTGLGTRFVPGTRVLVDQLKKSRFYCRPKFGVCSLVNIIGERHIIHVRKYIYSKAKQEDRPQIQSSHQFSIHINLIARLCATREKFTQCEGSRWAFKVREGLFKVLRCFKLHLVTTNACNLQENRRSMERWFQVIQNPSNACENMIHR